MSYNRTRFLIALAITGTIWLLCMFLGGEGWGPDESARRTFAAGGNAGLRSFAQKAALLGQWQVLIPATGLAAFYLAFKRRNRAGLLLIMGFLGWLLVLIQAMLVDRAKPDLPKYLEAAHSMSFPSTHAANAMFVFLAIALLLPGRRWINHVQITLALILAILAGWSQLALENVWASDVVGGWAFGMLWVIICIRLATDRPGD
jgi:undecaprenyl-diphosphatase